MILYVLYFCNFTDGFILPDSGFQQFCGPVYIGIFLDAHDNFDDMVTGMLDETSETNNVAWSDRTYVLNGATVCEEWTEKKCKQCPSCSTLI